MNIKQIGLLVVLVVAAIGIGRWRYTTAVIATQDQNPLNTRLTFDYQGTVGDLFHLLTEKCGMQYQLAPEAAKKVVQGSYKDSSILQIQADVARKAHLRYHPLDESGKTVVVESS